MGRCYVLGTICAVEVIVCAMYMSVCSIVSFFFFFQAEDGIRDLVRSRGLGDVYKRQGSHSMIGGALGNLPRWGWTTRAVWFPRSVRMAIDLSLIHI